MACIRVEETGRALIESRREAVAALAAVHTDLEASGELRLVEFGDERPLPADLPQGAFHRSPVVDPVTCANRG